MSSGKPITVPLDPKKRGRACADTPELLQDRYEILANATPATLSDDPFADCDLTEEREFRLADLFPARVLADDADQLESFLNPFLAALDPEMLRAFARVDCFPRIIDPQRAPSSFLDGLLAHLGNPFTLEEGQTDIEKRRLAGLLFQIYALKGT